MLDDLSTRPTVSLAPGKHKRAEHGHPWIYSNEVVLDARTKAIAPGSLVTILTSDGRRLGVGLFNPAPLITVRLLDRDPGRRIDAAYLAARVKRALEIRTRLFAVPFYRLIHAEADGLPGVIIDRYGDALVCQLNTAGMAALEPALIDALNKVLAPRTILMRNDSPARETEGLKTEIRLVQGTIDGPFQVEENGCRFLADLSAGQKTGWFFDQRPNRAFIAAMAKGASVLDAYCYTGGFGITAASRGAAAVTLVDRSEAALATAMAAARLNGVEDRVTAVKSEAFEMLERLNTDKTTFDIVVLDPPAFVKSRKDLGPGSRAYRKLARLGAGLVAKGGTLLAASCSHNMATDLFTEAVGQGLVDAGRTGRILHTGFAGPDHPTHPSLPESAYLKALVLAVD